jgi:ABC-type transport system involved in multi-copper enzyme maturation permease subunit
MAGAQVINGSRADGTLEFLLSQPIGRTAYFGGVTASRALVLVLPLVVLYLVFALAAELYFGQPVPWDLLLRALATSVALLLCYLGAGLAISTFVYSQARAVTWVLVVWLASVAVLDFALIGVLLAWRLEPRAVFALAVVNPVQASRMALLSAGNPELSILGPVGFYLAHRVGGSVLFLLGTAWPALLGMGAWLAAWNRFRRGDVV